MEKGFRFEADLTFETEPEFRNLRRSFDTIVKKGTKDELAKLLDSQPQRTANGKLIWLLTSGMAVEIATGIERLHHDLDVVVMNPKNIYKWEILGTDNVTPGQYWADMNFDRKYLEKTACKTSFAVGSRKYKVEIVHPVIIMAQKLSNAFGRPPRQKDVDDAAVTLKWWAKFYGDVSTWINVAKNAVEALPQTQREITNKRINTVVPKVVPLKRKLKQ
ncbi:MAG: hypothetical protein UX13_C0005G0011 [Candidatus Woesebacteria bacterium GW2011_GWB1_45_5]|uniref:Uncharacterized protein n=1 Tax=Candidatus Woesebacteria bacterium GW2011_GWB1_45_5 TaxID=1618581 RepID=A0A0G1PZ18_9BACT|nr:MAG: hypothetical protein UX13_C0005G0011 [Candidatus Woesebacteria bacterium GW2011_GWB1_45_5]